MNLERRRLVVGFWVTFIGLVFATLVAGVVFPTPSAPVCYTAVCNASSVSDLLGLGLIIFGMASLAAGLFRRGTAPAPPGTAPSVGPGYPAPPYSFTPPPPSTPLPPSPPPPAPAPALRHCPACGATVTAEYGFCPRCGRTLAP